MKDQRPLAITFDNIPDESGYITEETMNKLVFEDFTSLANIVYADEVDMAEGDPTLPTNLNRGCYKAQSDKPQNVNRTTFRR